MADYLIGQNENRQPVCLAHVKSGDCLIKNLLRGGWRKHDNFMVSVGTPSCLHHVTLGALCGKTC